MEIVLLIFLYLKNYTIGALMRVCLQQLYMIFVLISVFMVAGRASSLRHRLHELQMIHNRYHLDVSEEEQRNYLEQLLTVQSDLKSKVEELKQYSEQLNQDVDKYYDLPTVQLQKLQQGIANERQLLYETTNQFHLPSNTQIACQNISESEAQQITEQISSIQNQINKLKSDLAHQTSEDCIIVNQLESQIRFLQAYTNQLSMGMTNICEIEQVKKFYSLNTDAVDYTYGNSSQSQENYQNKVQQFLDDGYLKVQCSSVSPYPYKFEKCVSCPDNTHYDLSKNVCLACPQNYYFDPDGHICTMKKFNNNPNIQGNYIGTLPQTSDQAQTCPSQKPFFDSQQCIQCSLPSYFDFGTLKCKQCEDSLVFSISQKSCRQQKWNTNSNADDNYCCGGIEIDPTLKTCPIQKPFFDSSQCIECQLPSYFNFEKLACESCENGLVFLAQSKTCGYQQWNTNNEAAKNFCCGLISIDPTLKTCPASTPYFNGKKCIACQAPSYFSLDNLVCTLCPSGQGFSEKKSKCIDLQYLKDVGYVSFINDNVQNYKGSIPSPDDDYNTIQSCPELYPFYNGQHCTTCLLPSYFNFNTNLCQVCPQLTKFSIQTHDCQNLPDSQMMNTNLAVIKNFKGSIPDYNQNLATCPQKTPFFNGNTCVSCYLPSYVNFDTQQCLSCSSGMNFNTFNRQCETIVRSHYTDLSANNIYYNGDFDDIVDQTNKLRSENPSMTQCSSDKPFYNAGTDQCQDCPEKYPLFDIKYHRCISCTGTSHFDNAKHVCLNSGVIQPTIERMLMNTIGFL